MDHIGGGTGWNMDSILSSIADQLNESVMIERTRNLLTWTACLTVGQAFAQIPTNLHKKALRELAGRTRRSTRTLSNYLRVHSAVRDLDLPHEAMEVLQYSACLAVLTEYGDERGRAMILEIHDGDLSLMQARVDQTAQEIREARADRKHPTLIQAFTQAIGEIGRRIAGEPLTNEERQQLHRALDTIIGEQAEPQNQGDT